MLNKVWGLKLLEEVCERSFDTLWETTWLEQMQGFSWKAQWGATPIGNNFNSREAWEATFVLDAKS